MSHITCQSERDENEEIRNCQFRAVKVWKTWIDDWTGEQESDWIEENQCGDSETISVAKDRCTRCGKIFTY